MRELIVVLNLSVRQPIKKRIKERCEANQCLLCDDPQHSRGLCRRHHSQFTYKVRGLNKRQRADFEADLIVQGSLLEAHDQTMKAPRSVFEAARRKAANG